MDFELTDEQPLIRETAREFTDSEIAQRARENYRNEHFDLDLVHKIAAQGYLGAIVPREYGGAGLDYVTYGMVVEEVGRGDSAMRTVVSVQTSLVCSAHPALGHRGAEAALPAQAVLGRVARVLRPHRARHRLGRGQPAHPGQEDGLGLGDQRRQDVDLDGQSRQRGADLRPDRSRARPPGLAGFLVETDQPGFQPPQIHHKLGLRGSDTAAISLHDFEVPEDAHARRGRATASRSR